MGIRNINTANGLGGMTMRKKAKWFALWIGILAMLTGCTELPEVGTADVTPTEWQLILDSSKKTTINVYHDYTDPLAKTWMDVVMVPYIEEKLGVKVVLNTLKMNELLPKLKDEKLNEVAIGSADLLILTKKGFGQLKDAGVLYGPYSNKLPNVAMNQVSESYENAWLDGKPMDDMAVQLGKNQLVLFFDEDQMETAPATLSELKQFIIANPGKFTFPSLDSAEGQAFVNTLAASLCDQKKLYEGKLDAKQQEALYAPVGAFLKEIRPYMWMQGKQLPKNVAELDRLFKEGQVSFSMSLDQNKAVSMIKEEKFPDGAKAYVLSSGTTGFGQYAVIPFNSANKSGAMSLINELLGGEMQGSKYNPKNWGNLPSVDPMKMEKTASSEITKVTLKRNALKEAELSAARLPQIPSDKAYQLVVYIKKTLGL
jgi:putative spermidine/putrescine transport system substrate-binding protein